MTALLVADEIARVLASVDPDLDLRRETDADFVFVSDLYAEVRHAELAPVAWTDAAKRDFLDSQCRLQWDHYAAHYAGADRLIVLSDGMPVGRLYVHVKPKEIRLMEIALVAGQRNRGIGTMIVQTLQDAARRCDAELTLHVEPNNPAQHLYKRLGFRLIENRGVYDFLGWPESAIQRLS
jgi:ribosomal protein S18 acetylase RimI-like enzyme